MQRGFRNRYSFLNASPLPGTYPGHLSVSEKLTYQPSEKWNEQPSYGIRKAVENIVNAPQQITTGFRAFIMNDDWFKRPRLR